MNAQIATPRLTRRQLAKIKTASAMVAAARKLWAEPGSYEAVGIREISAEAGYSTGAFFANFPTKAAMWRIAMGYEPPVDGPVVRAALIAAATAQKAA